MKTHREHSSFSLLFFINRSKIKQDGTCPILLRITIGGRLLAVSIRRTVNPEIWESRTGMAIGRSTDAAVLNKYIDALKVRAYERYNDLLLSHDEVSPAMLRDAIFNMNASQGKSLISIWQDHNRQLHQLIGRDTSYTTWQKNNACLNHMIQFLKDNGYEADLPIKLVDRYLITRFEHYLKSEKGCSANTTVKFLQNLRKIVRMALLNGWIKNDPFTGVRLTIKDAERPYLTSTEIETIEAKQFGNKRLDHVRDMFLFACYTGLAYIDIYSLTHGQLETDPDGITWIRILRTKTKVRANVPLLDTARQIINKYSSASGMPQERKVLPVISNQKMNAYLKEIADVCGISKKLTFHVARHTFATTITLMNGVPIESVSRMLGHTNIKTTQHYARIVDTKVGEDMKKLAEKMGSRLG